MQEKEIQEENHSFQTPTINKEFAMSPDVIRDYTDAFKKLAIELATGNSLPKGIKNAGDLIMYMQAGRDLGITLTESLNSLAFINGRMTMYGPKLIARARSYGYNFKFDEGVEEIKKLDEEGNEKIQYNKYCVCTMRHKNDISYTRTEKWDLVKANKAGLLGKDVWKNYPETMLRYRSFGDCVKFFAPVVLGGVSMYEEVKDYGGDNEYSNKESYIQNINTLDTTVMDGFNTFVEGGEINNKVIITDTQIADDIKKTPEVGDIVLFNGLEYLIEDIIDGTAIISDDNGDITKTNLSTITCK